MAVPWNTVRPLPFIPGRISDKGKNLGACAHADSETVRTIATDRVKQPAVLLFIGKSVFSRLKDLHINGVVERSSNFPTLSGFVLAGQDKAMLTFRNHSLLDHRSSFFRRSPNRFGSLAGEFGPPDCRIPTSETSIRRKIGSR